MRNIIEKSYINKVINIKSEILFREAEDDFYYFNKINCAIKKLKEAVLLTPNHLKSLILLADIYFVKGNIKKALNLYLTAEKLSPLDFKVLASIANCYNSMKNYLDAVNYCDKAINSIETINYSLYSQVIEIKISNLISLKQYDDAYSAYIQSEKILKDVVFDYDFINEKLKLQKKLAFSGLKIV